MDATDRELIRTTLRGDTQSFGILVARYQDRLFNAVYRLVNHVDDTYDVVQEAFLNAYQSLHSFKGDSEFFTWLYRIAFNSAVSLKRKQRAILSLDAGKSDDPIVDPMDQSVESEPGSTLERTEDEARLQRALNLLSAEHRAVLVLKDIEGLKYEDIAEVLDVPIGTIRSRLHRARLELREILERRP